MNQERHYKRKHHVIILEYINFEHDPQLLYDVQAMWENGYSITEIADALKLKGDHKDFEAFCILYHLVTMGWIQPREGGMWG